MRALTRPVDLGIGLAEDAHGIPRRASAPSALCWSSPVPPRAGRILDKLGFVGVRPLDTGRPSYHPAVMLKLYIYGYLDRVTSSRRLERECQRNIELIWLTGQLAPAFKTIADFRKDNGRAIREVCREFVALCRKLDCLVQRASRSMGRSSKPSMHGTRTSPSPR
jgi:hypothetical protein